MLQKILNRPVLATVVSIILVFLGIIGLNKLPRTLFPDIAPPSVYVSGSYPGGNSESVIRSAIIPLEEAINGVEGMQYMSSTAGNDGSFTISIVFELGTDPDKAAVNVQNRVAQVNGNLPPEVIQVGITTVKRQNGNIMMFNLNSNDKDKYDELFLQNYAKINIVPAIKRIKGVGDVQIFGTKDYAIRIWLDPQKLAVNNLIPSDIERAISNASFEASPGKLGTESQAPMQYTIKYKGKFNTQEDFEKIVIKSNSDGSMLRIRDVARVEFGASFYESDNKENGQPAVSLGIQQTSGSNANSIETEVRELLQTMSKDFPKGVNYYILQSTKERLDEAVNQVLTTLLEAFILVILVVFLFLQDFRSTFIPAIAVPVSIIGSFFFLFLFGFSINVLTLFALVLAIGIVVDDAIVVVEAVYSKIEQGKEPKEATRSAMSEITGVIISITLVMCAVFLPVGFMEGPAGIFYKQFAFTLVFAILISAVNALTLSPVLCTLFLKNEKDERTGYYRLKDNFFNGFNTGFKILTNKYLSLVKLTVKNRIVTGGVLMIITISAFWMMNKAPKDFIPEEDDNFIMYGLTLPSGTNLQYTTVAINKIDSVLKLMPEVESVTSISGFGMLSDNSGSSSATGFIRLKAHKERGEIQDMNKIIEAMNNRLENIKSGDLSLFRSPPVEGFGNVSGAEMVIQDRTGGNLDKFNQITQDLISKLNENPAISTAFTSFRSDFPQFEIEIDEDKTYQLGTTPRDVLQTLQQFNGESQSGDFIRFGKFYHVNIKAEGEYRMDEKSLNQIFVKNNKGDMIPIHTLIHLKKVYGPESINRYNLYNSISVNIFPAIGYTSGQSMNAAEKIELVESAMRTVKLNYLPDISAQMNGNYTHSSRNSLAGQQNGAVISKEYTFSLGLNWDIDIWGKIRREKQETLANYLRQEEVRKTVQMKLTVDVAKAYYHLLMLDRQLEIANRSKELTDSTLHSVEIQYKVGDANLLGVQQVKAQLEQNKQLISQIEQSIASQENALSLLCGNYAQNVKRQLAADEEFLQVPKDGYPAAILVNRPDVRAAEYALAAANARVGIQKSAMYPAIYINASGGLNSLSASNWFNIPASLFGTIAGGITQPIFNKRRLKEQYKQAKIEREKEVINFRQSVLEAFSQISEALKDREEIEKQYVFSKNREEALKAGVRSSTILFRAGNINYLEVISVQINYLQAQLETANLYINRINSNIELYYRLGGGWK